MTNYLENKYFNWMYNLVYGKSYSHTVEFKKLFTDLFNIDFRYTIPLDENRAMDGIDLRYRFGDECGYQDYEICSEIDYRPCSVLEMMVALALRCEEDLMQIPDLGDRTGEWFWYMVTSLGLGHMNDNNYDQELVQNKIENFLDHNYKPNGNGGLFYMPGIKNDLRYIEIWDQAMWYLDDLLIDFD